MLRIFVYLTGIINSSLIGYWSALLAEHYDKPYTTQMVVFLFATMFSIVATILVVEGDDKQQGPVFRFYRWLGRGFIWVGHGFDYISVGLLMVLRMDVSDHLQVFVNGEQVHVWDVNGRVPEEVLLLGITEADCEKAIKGTPISFHRFDFIELMPVAFGYKSRLVARS